MQRFFAKPLVLRGLILFSLGCSFNSAFADVPKESSKPAQPKSIYFGQPLPAETPVPFAPTILQSLSIWVDATSFSPDGTQVFLSVGSADYSQGKLYFAQSLKGTWGPFVAASFTSDFSFASEPVFAADGKSVTFTGKKSGASGDLWTSVYSGQSWGKPVALPSPINSEAEEFRGSTDSSGTFYFGRTVSGMMQVYKAFRDPVQNIVVEILGKPINTHSYEGDPCIAPDGSFLVFYSARDGRSSDLFVSFKNDNGAWGVPVHLGPEFNTADDEYGAHLSRDGKFLFFTRHNAQGNTIFWVSVAAIEKLRT